MPKGAGLKRLVNKSDPRLLDYIAANAESWYRFINGERRRDAQNGDVRVIWGCHKCVAWGLAAFSSELEDPRPKLLRFRRSTPAGDPNEPNYHWDYVGSGSTIAKAGPEPWEDSDLFSLQTRLELQNQNIFIKAVGVSVSKDAWERVSRPLSTSVHHGSSPMSPNTMPTQSTTTSSFPESSTSTAVPRNHGNQGGRNAVSP